jgi:hypothetical protein
VTTLLTREDVAELIDKPVGVVDRRRRAGELGEATLVGYRDWRFNRDDIARYMAEQKRLEQEAAKHARATSSERGGSP